MSFCVVTVKTFKRADFLSNYCVSKNKLFMIPGLILKPEGTILIHEIRSLKQPVVNCVDQNAVLLLPVLILKE
jgi:hypothetical protein